jgi:hypothetical protein
MYNDVLVLDSDVELCWRGFVSEGYSWKLQAMAEASCHARREKCRPSIASDV